MRIGITGHQDIPNGALPFVKDGIERTLSRFRSDLTGLSCLAAGADQLFAESILSIGGQLHAIIPCDGYETTFKEKKSLARFRHLLAKAKIVEQLEYRHPSEDAFFDAGRRIVEQSQILVAIWDGQSVKGKGGTADIVSYAREKKIEVVIVWPPGMSR